MRHRPVKFCSRAFTIVVLHVCFPVEWKGGRKGPSGAKLLWAKACGGKWWDPGSEMGRQPSTQRKPHRGKRKWQPQINSTFQRAVSSSGVPEVHCALCFPEHRHLCPPPFTLICPLPPSNLLSGTREKLYTEITLQIFLSLLLYNHVMFYSGPEMVLH